MGGGTPGYASSERISTYEGIADRILGFLRQKEALPCAGRKTPWDAFLRLSKRIHEAYEVPATTITPMMRRLLFALGFAARPHCLVGVGTYVGYAFSWLLRDRSDPEAGPFLESALGVDVDADANRIAERNCEVLGHGRRIAFTDLHGVDALRRFTGTIDLLYLDIDDSRQGKAGYCHVLEAASPYLRPGSLVLAHDPCVPRFQPDFTAYHDHVRRSGRFSGVWVFPIDPCGLSVALAQ